MRLASVALASAALFTGTTAANAITIAGSFDGFCDGFSLTPRVNGSASGVETGCLSGPIAGRWTARFKRGPGGGGAATVESHLPGNVYEINTTFHTWAIFEPNGRILDAGTWTATPQSRANRGLPATGTVRRH
jgi:hypothetical protein